jgi:hypothetical protein
MIPISTEDGLAAKPGMWIDSASLTGRMMCLIGFGLIFFFTLDAGPLRHATITRRPFKKHFRNATTQALAFEIPGISKWNRFVRLEIAFTTRDLESPVAPYGFELTVTPSNRTARSDFTVQRSGLTFSRLPGSRRTKSLVVFDDRLISYEYLNFLVKKIVQGKEKESGTPTNGPAVSSW